MSGLSAVFVCTFFVTNNRRIRPLWLAVNGIVVVTYLLKHLGFTGPKKQHIQTNMKNNSFDNNNVKNITRSLSDLAIQSNDPKRWFEA